MAKYYFPSTTFDAIRVSLLDYYGAYDATTNPTGVDVQEYSSTLLIFSCTAISDKIIKLAYSNSLVNAFYGDAYSGSGVITNEVRFTTSNTTGSTTAIHMVCAVNTLLINTIGSYGAPRVIVIGKLTNDAYAVLGTVGSSNSVYFPSTYGYLTADQTTFNLYGIVGEYTIGSKRLIMPFVIVMASGDALNDGGNIITFRDLYSVSRALGANTASKEIGYFMTMSGLYNAAAYAIKNSMIMEVTN